MYKRILAIVVSLMMTFTMLASGCGSRTQGSQSENTVTVVDCLGNEVKVPQQVERVGALYSFAGHAVTMLGKGRNIVAVSNGLKRDVILTQICPSILDAVAPKGNNMVNIEELAKAKPDVVFIEDDFNGNENVKEQFKKFNIPVLIIKYSNIEEQIKAVNMIARVIGAEDKAKQYEQYYRDSAARVQEKVKDMSKEERARVYHSVNEAFRTDSKDSLPADWMQVAGAVNVSVDEQLKLTDNKYYANIEQILKWNPDFIFVNEDSVDEYIMKDSKWKNINAVKENKVYQLPNGISRWGHPGSLETPLAILWSAKILYPEKFQDIDMEAETKKFYSEFFNYTFSDQKVDEMLKGVWMRTPKN